MKIKQTTSLLAMAALLGSVGVAFADVGASTYGASVSVLSPDNTGFIIGGQVAVNGLGSGALTMTRSAAVMGLTGSAYSQKSFDDGITGSNPVAPALAGVKTGSNVESSLVFDRKIDTSGSLVGKGTVISSGQAMANMGTQAAANSNAYTAGAKADGSGAGSATSDSNSQGSLNGGLSTSNTLQLKGDSSLFAGSNALSVGEKNTAIGYGNADVTADTSTTGIDLTKAKIASPVAGDKGLLHGTLNGALFNVASDLTSVTNPTETDPTKWKTGIAMSVSNAGNGSISLSTSTGGFFTGGAAAGGNATAPEIGSFFSNHWTTP